MLLFIPRSHVRALFLAASMLVAISSNDLRAQSRGDDGGIAGVIGTGFNYQGVFKQGGVPFSGQAEFAFSLWDAPTGGNHIADSIPPSQYVTVTSGQFSAMIDFGPTAFTANEPRFMVVAVRVPPGVGNFTGLSPRQSITPTPWALYALNGAGLTLPYIVSASANDLALLQMTNTHPAGGGVYGNATVYGVAGDSTSGYGVLGRATQGNGYGVHGQNVPTGNYGSLGTGSVGVYGQHTAQGNYGELGTPSVGAQGVVQTPDGTGVVGTHVGSNNVGRLATVGHGVVGQAGSALAIGVRGENPLSGNSGELGRPDTGVYGVATQSGIYAVRGYNTATGATGELGGLVGVSGSYTGNNGTTVASLGTSGSAIACSASGSFQSAVVVESAGLGISVTSTSDQYEALQVTNQSGGPAATMTGSVYIYGSLQASTLLVGGAKWFQINHPLDPENKYLAHSCIEAPEAKNLYDGIVKTDGAGYATIVLPSYFEALNETFRYQLTVLDEGDEDAFVLAKVTSKIADNQFTIRTSEPHVEVSWQVTGVRHDEAALKNPLQVERLKTDAERQRDAENKLIERRRESAAGEQKVATAAGVHN